MEEATKNLLFGVLFFILGMILLILSILDIRSYGDNDNQSIKDSIDTINRLSYIIIVLSLIFIAIGVVIILKKEDLGYLTFFTSLSDRTKSFIMIGTSLLIVMVGIIQRVKINEILPDMSDVNSVKRYDDTHTVSSSTVLGSNTGVLVIGGMLGIAGIAHFFMKEKIEDLILSEREEREKEYDDIIKREKKALEEIKETLSPHLYKQKRLRIKELENEAAAYLSSYDKAFSEAEQKAEGANIITKTPKLTPVTPIYGQVKGQVPQQAQIQLWPEAQQPPKLNFKFGF